MTLAEFLDARLAEDEAVAEAAAVKRRGRWRKAGDHVRLIYTDQDEGGLVAESAPEEVADHITLHDPARVLREVEAKRAILSLAREANGLEMQIEQEFGAEPRDLAADPRCGDQILRALAAVFSEHPDYDPAWKA